MITARSVRRNLISKYAYMNRLVGIQFMNYHTIGKSKASIESGPSVTVYDSKEFNELRDIPHDQWFGKVTKSSHIKKYMELIPFFVEARYKPKNFVLRMDLLPDSDYLRFYTLTLSGVYEKYEPLKYIVPVTKYDYRVIYGRILFKQSPILDLDMVYGNHGTKELYVFDKKGNWHDEGVNHEKLSLENTYDETNWFDEFNAERM